MIPVQMIPVQTILKALAGASALLVIPAALCLSPRALAQTDHPVRTLTSSSAPLLAVGGEKLLFCAANNLPAVQTPPPSVAAASPAANTTLTVTLQILNGVTGAVVAQKQVALPPLGAFEPPDPCITFDVAPASFTPSTSLFVARILLNPQPLPPGRCRADSLTASLQVFTPDATGNPTDIRTLAFTPPDPCSRPFFRRGPPPTAVNP
jgi:hypothetical protein